MRYFVLAQRRASSAHALGQVFIDARISQRSSPLPGGKNGQGFAARIMTHAEDYDPLREDDAREHRSRDVP